MWLVAWLLAFCGPVMAQTGLPSPIDVGNQTATAVVGWGNYLQSMVSAYLPAALPWAFTTLGVFAAVGIFKVIIQKL